MEKKQLMNGHRMSLSASWFSRLWPWGKGPDAARNIEAEITLLREKNGKLQQINDSQNTAIVYLKEINRRLREKGTYLTNYFLEGPLRRHEEQQHQTMQYLIRLNQDLSPLLTKGEEGGAEVLTPEYLTKLRGRSKQIESLVIQMRMEMGRQRQELLQKLEEKELSLRLQESDMESIVILNQKLNEEVRRLRLENSSLQREVQEKEKLQLALRKHENEEKYLSKKCQALSSKLETLVPAQHLEQESSLMRKTVTVLEDRLRSRNSEIAQLKINYEKLLEEYQRLFTEA